MQFSFFPVLVSQAGNYIHFKLSMMKYLPFILGVLITLFGGRTLHAQLSASVNGQIQLISIKNDGLYTNAPLNHTEKAKDILAMMHKSILKMRSHSYRLKLEERRIGNTYHKGEMLVSVRNHPLNVRMEVLAPNKGAVVEYNASEDKSEAFVTPRKWAPAIKFKRDIHGNLLRPGHYSIDETSLNFIGGIIKKSEALFTQRGIYQKGVRYWGQLHIEGVACHKIEFMDHEYRTTAYQVKKGESLISLARAKVINPYKIKELNPSIKTYYDVKPGQTILIPTSYAKKCVIYIDTENNLPRRLEIYDEQGWFERYSFFDIRS